MKSKIEQEEPHIVRDYYIGDTHIMIADNYCKSKEESKSILNEVRDKALDAFRAGRWTAESYEHIPPELRPAAVREKS